MTPADRKPLLLLLLLLLLCRSESLATAPDGSCSQSLNLGLDYFLDTKFFANLTDIDLPRKIRVPVVSALTIHNLRITGLENVSRGCNLELTVPSASSLRLKACASMHQVHVTFMAKAVGFRVDFVRATVRDAGASVVVDAEIVPNGRLLLRSFEVTLGSISVVNTGVTGYLATRMLQLSIVRNKISDAIESAARRRIAAELRKIRLPQ